MKNKKTKIVTTLAISTALSFGLVQNASAATAQGNANYELQQINRYLARLPDLIHNAIGMALNQASHFMFETVPGIGKTIASNESVKPVLQHEKATTAQTTKAMSDYYLGIKDGKKLKQEGDIIDNAYDNIKATVGKKSSLSADNFLAPNKYNSDNQAKAAKNYVALASGSAIAPAPPTGISKTKPTSQQAQYLNEYHTLAAIHSLSSYNLSKLYAQRVGMNTKDIPSLTDTNQKTISSKQLFQYLQMHKATDPSWYKKMATASPFTVIREIANFAAGGFMALYRIEQTQQQILATLSEQNTLMLMQAKDKLKVPTSSN